jgi:hypothetical protein
MRHRAAKKYRPKADKVTTRPIAAAARALVLQLEALERRDGGQ